MQGYELAIRWEKKVSMEGISRSQMVEALAWFVIGAFHLIIKEKV